MKEQGCASPEHVAGCPCPRCKKPPKECPKCPELTEQHVIPRCIGKKVLGMSNGAIDKYKQSESKACHKANDPLVPERFTEMMKLKRSGVIFTIQDVLTMRENGAFKKH